MKRAAFLFYWVLSAVITLAQTQPAKSGAGRRAPEIPQNGTMLIAINEVVGSVAEPGWPLIVAATRVPDDKEPPAALPLAFGLRLTDGSGVSVAVTLEPVPPLPNQTTSLFWLASETTTARLAPGIYRVSPIAGQSQLTGWRVEPGEFQIVAPDSTRKNLLSHLRIHRSVLLGKTEEALTTVNQLTSENANDAEAWIAKGDIHMLQDQPAEALDAYDRALNLQKDSEREPIAIMVRRSNAFTRSLEKRGVIAPKPP